MDFALSFCSIVIFIIILQVTSYNLRCPTPSEWRFRAKKCSKTETYYCLFYNVNNTYVEGCEGPDWDRKGSKRVWAGSFTRGSCQSDRYQPFKFWTNGSSDCVYQKSLCNEEGQVVYNNGTSKDDRFCSCDFTSGYAFVVTPSNLCYCDLSLYEDCSCYRKPCPEYHTLSADYKCVTNTSSGTTCQNIVKLNPKEVPDKQILPRPSDALTTDEVLDIYRQKKRTTFYFTLVAFAFIFMIIDTSVNATPNNVSDVEQQLTLVGMGFDVDIYGLSELVNDGSPVTILAASCCNSSGNSNAGIQGGLNNPGLQPDQDPISADPPSFDPPAVGTSSDHQVIHSTERNIDNGDSAQMLEKAEFEPDTVQPIPTNIDENSLEQLLTGHIDEKSNEENCTSELQSVDGSSDERYSDKSENSEERSDEEENRSTSADSIDGSTNDSEEVKEVYYLRIVHLLFTLASPVLRIKFNEEINPKSLCYHLRLHEKSIHKKHLSKHERDTLYPKRNKNKVTSVEFDITLMTMLLKVIADLGVGSTGYKANILKIFDYRDRLRIQGQLSFKEFKEQWDDISQTILRLSSSVLQYIEQSSTDDSSTSLIKGRIKALNPLDFQSKRLHKFVHLSDVCATKVLCSIIMEYCDSKNISIQSLLKKEKHTLFHKRKKTTSCCQCKKMASFHRYLSEEEWNAMYMKSKRRNSHVDKICKGKPSKCLDHFCLKDEFDLKICDKSVLICIILYIPAILKSTMRKICSSAGFEHFLDKQKHELYHHAMDDECCKCIQKPNFEKFLRKENWDNLYEMNESTSQSCETPDCQLCIYRPHKKIKIEMVDDNLLATIARSVGPVAMLIAVEVDIFKCFIGGGLKKQILQKAYKDTKRYLKQLLNIISDVQFKQDLKKSISEGPMADTDLQKWASKHLENRREPSDSHGQMRPVLIKGPDGLKIYDVKASGGYKIAERKPQNVTKAEIYFLRVFNMLSKIACPALRVIFDKEFPPETVVNTIIEWSYGDKLNKTDENNTEEKSPGNGDEQDRNTQQSNTKEKTSENGDEPSRNTQSSKATGNGNKIQMVKPRLPLTEKQQKVIFSNQLGTSEQYDIQLMGYLLKQKKKRIKIESDISLRDVQKLMDVYDKIVHSSDGQLTQSDFNEYWEDIKQASVRLGGEHFNQLCLELEQLENILRL